MLENKYYVIAGEYCTLTDVKEIMEDLKSGQYNDLINDSVLFAIVPQSKCHTNLNNFNNIIRKDEKDLYLVSSDFDNGIIKTEFTRSFDNHNHMKNYVKFVTAREGYVLGSLKVFNVTRDKVSENFFDTYQRKGLIN